MAQKPVHGPVFKTESAVLQLVVAVVADDGLALPLLVALVLGKVHNGLARPAAPPLDLALTNVRAVDVGIKPGGHGKLDVALVAQNVRCGSPVGHHIVAMAEDQAHALTPKCRRYNGAGFTGSQLFAGIHGGDQGGGQSRRRLVAPQSALDHLLHTGGRNSHGKRGLVPLGLGRKAVGCLHVKIPPLFIPHGQRQCRWPAYNPAVRSAAPRCLSPETKE